MRSEQEVRSILDRALSQLSAEEGMARYGYEWTLATRFGENAITQNIGGAQETVTIGAAFGRRHGTATTNRLDDDSLVATAARAEAIARRSPEDPEYVGLPGPQVYGDRPQRLFADVVALRPEDVAEDVRLVVDRARTQGLRASGLFGATVRAGGLRNTRGLWAWDAASDLDYSTTFHGANGSGKAAQVQSSRERIDVEKLAATALANTMLAQNPVALEPGLYTAILEPAAVGELLAFIVFTMGARDAEEGQTPFANTLGTKLMHETVSLRLRVDDPILPAPVYGEDGLPIEPVTWVENGVVRRLYHDRYWAQQKGTHADAARTPLFMDGEERSTEELVANCTRGLLVKNLWYLRFVDRRSLMVTGMTRDGLFWIEDGRIVRPVKNLRWNESPIRFLQNVLGLSRPERVGGEFMSSLMPGVLAEGFHFTSTTDAV